MERHIIFTKHLDEFNTEQDIIDAKDMIKFEVRAIIESEEPIHVKSLIKYIFVLKKLDLSQEKVHELYMSQLSSLLFGKTIQFGSGYLRVTNKKNNKTIFTTHAGDSGEQEIFSMFPEQSNKDFNKFFCRMHFLR